MRVGRVSLERRDENEWIIEPHGRMRVPAVIFGSERLVEDMDEKVFEQAMNVAALPGIVRASYAMPDAHWGYGFPIGGVAAFDAGEGGVVSAGGVGFDISCGVRTLHTGLSRAELAGREQDLADALFRTVPAGVGSTGRIRLAPGEVDDMLTGGASWAVGRGFGTPEDLERTEERGRMTGADPDQVSGRAKKRQRDQMGTLGSGNHYLEVQEVTEVFNGRLGETYGLRAGDLVVTIHCGSRGLGHQIGTDYLKEMLVAAAEHGLRLPERELASAPLGSATGRRYLGAMRAGMNCALANRQVITHLTRQAFTEVFPQARLPLLYDVSHNTCKEEEHVVDGRPRKLWVHRKGATRAFGPGHPDVPAGLREAGQPVLIGGTMGTCSYVLAGAAGNEERSFSSACHGAGRAMSRNAARKRWKGRAVVDRLREQGILVRSVSDRGVAEEAPGAYKDVSAVVDATHRAGLANRVAKLVPVICVKG